MRLAGLIDWHRFESAFGTLYHETAGRPGKPMRLMVGLTYLKHTYNLSDEQVCERWVENLMSVVAGQYMAVGTYGYKKGKTYDWPLKHLGDAFEEVTPRSFLGLLIAAAKRGAAPLDRVITADSLRHGLREASKTRVDQLRLEFPWIKAVLAPLAGLLLPQNEDAVFSVWRRARTVDLLIKDAVANSYLPPFPAEKGDGERSLFEALKRIGVTLRRKDDRIDMPDLFRVAARLLKKGGTAPV